MTDAGSTPRGSLGLVERVAALHRVRMFADVPGRVLAAVAEAAVEQRVSPGLWRSSWLAVCARHAANP